MLFRSGMLWQHVKSGLELLDAKEQTDLITTAIGDFPEGTPSAEQSDRRQALGALTQEQKSLWRAGEDRVYAVGGFFDTLRPFWTRYIESHPDDFFLPSDR